MLRCVSFTNPSDSRHCAVGGGRVFDRLEFFVVQLNEDWSRLCAPVSCHFALATQGSCCSSWRMNGTFRTGAGPAAGRASRRRQNGESEFENAAREFSEESICVFRGDFEPFERSLEQQSYAMRVNIVTEHRKSAPNALPSLHATFIKQFPYTPSLPEQFKERRADLLALQQASESFEALKRSLLTGQYPFLREGVAWSC